MFIYSYHYIKYANIMPGFVKMQIMPNYILAVGKV